MGTRTNHGTGTSTASSLRARYARSSTVSVTQLLTDSCSSLLNRLTSRVRGPSTVADKPLTVTSTSSRLDPERDRENIEPPRRHHRHQTTDLHGAAAAAAAAERPARTTRHEDTTRSRLEERYADSTRSRLEDKYSAALERYSRKKEKERSTGRSLAKSATTHSILLSEKAYPYVSASTSSSSSSVVREKTPYRSERHRRHTEARQHTEVRQHKSRPLRTNELSDSRLTLVPTNSLAPLATAELDEPAAAASVDSDTDVDRRAKRKEIQSLIMKYTGVEDGTADEASSVLARCQQKYSGYLAHKTAASASTSTVSVPAAAAAVTVSVSTLPLPLPLPLVSPHLTRPSQSYSTHHITLNTLLQAFIYSYFLYSFLNKAL